MRTKRIKISMIIMSLALFLGLALLMPDISARASNAVNLRNAMSIKCVVDDASYLSDLMSSDPVFDIYLVAEAEESAGGGLEYTLLAPYSRLSLNILERESAAQTAALIALSEDSPAAADIRLGDTVSRDSAGRRLKPGIYMLLPHGRGLSDYLGSLVNDEGESAVCAWSYSERYEYAFAPALIELPEKDAQSGEWNYNVELNLKVYRRHRLGAVEIEKTLIRYEDSAPAIFVFEIKAVLDGETVYNDIRTISFTSAGQKKLSVEGIPAGAQATVSEIYSGPRYQTVGESSAGALVRAGETATLSFVNDFVPAQTSVLGIVNKFTYDAASTWDWQQLNDNMP